MALTNNAKLVASVARNQGAVSAVSVAWTLMYHDMRPPPGGLKKGMFCGFLPGDRGVL